MAQTPTLHPKPPEPISLQAAPAPSPALVALALPGESRLTPNQRPLGSESAWLDTASAEIAKIETLSKADNKTAFTAERFKARTWIESLKGLLSRLNALNT